MIIIFHDKNEKNYKDRYSFDYGTWLNSDKIESYYISKDGAAVIAITATGNNYHLYEYGYSQREKAAYTIQKLLDYEADKNIKYVHITHQGEVNVVQHTVDRYGYKKRT